MMQPALRGWRKRASNLYRVKSPHPLLKDKHEFTLFKEAHNLEPNPEIEAKLLNTLLNWFSYAHHEWPAIILYGTDGADVEHCEEILQEIEFAKSLDHERKHEDYLSEFESKVHEYIKRLQNCG